MELLSSEDERINEEEIRKSMELYEKEKMLTKEIQDLEKAEMEVRITTVLKKYYHIMFSSEIFGSKQWFWYYYLWISTVDSWLTLTSNKLELKLIFMLLYLQFFIFM